MSGQLKPHNNQHMFRLFLVVILFASLRPATSSGISPALFKAQERKRERLRLQKLAEQASDAEDEATTEQEAEAETTAAPVPESNSTVHDFDLQCAQHTAGEDCAGGEPEGEAEAEAEAEPETDDMGVSCDLGSLVSDLEELEAKVDLIIEQATHFNKVIKFGGFTSAAGLVLFIGYLLLLATIAVAKYVRNRRTEQEENNQKAIERAAHTAARRVAKKSRKADSREDLATSLM